MEVQGSIDRRAEEIRQVSGKPVVSWNSVDPQKDFIVISLRDVEWSAIDACIKHGFQRKTSIIWLQVKILTKRISFIKVAE